MEELSTTHLWVCAYPYIDSTLFVIPASQVPGSPVAGVTAAVATNAGESSSSSAASQASADRTHGDPLQVGQPQPFTAQQPQFQAQTPARTQSFQESFSETNITVYDADGNVANEVRLQFPAQQIGIVELESIMGGCKLEGGMKHGHMLVQSAPGYSHLCRIHTREGAALIGSPALLTADRSSFFPITFDEGRQFFLAFVNETRTSANVKCRLFCGKRSPETLISIPPLGARVVHVETEFPDYASGDAGKQLQAYVRISTKSEARIGVQLLERHATKAEGGVFSAVG